MLNTKGATKPYYLLVAHPDRDAIFSIDGKIPEIEHDADAWLPNEPVAVLKKVRERFGLRATLLREIHRGEPQVCELEFCEPPGSDVQWLNRRELYALPTQLRVLVERWFVEREPNNVPTSRSPWERPGWFAVAHNWATDHLRRLRLSVSGEIEQLKGAWPYSCVFRVPIRWVGHSCPTSGEVLLDGYLSCDEYPLLSTATDVGQECPTHRDDVYFKAVCDSQANEPALIEELARRWPANVPHLLAIDRERRWMLMRDFGGSDIAHLADFHRPLAVQRFAEIQIDSATHIQTWANLGCEDRSPWRIVEGIAALLADETALQPPTGERLSDDEVAQIRIIAEMYKRLCQQLDEFRIPLTLVNQDFRIGNIAFANDCYIFYDWADSVIGQPFFSATRFLNYIKGDEHVKQPIIDAYLEPWQSMAPMEKLREAFAIARRINAMYQAVRFHIAMRRAEPDIGWEECVVDQLRDVLINESAQAPA